MQKYKLRRFVFISLVSVVLLSLVWSVLGKSYTGLLITTLSPLLPMNTELHSQGHLLKVIARPVSPTIMFEVQQDGVKEVYKVDLTYQSPEALNAWLIKYSGSPLPEQHETFEGRMVFYGLIPAMGLMLALPGVTLRARFLFMVAVLVLGFCTHLVGLYFIVQTFSRAVNDAGSTSGFQAINGVIGFLMLLVPSLLWVPMIFGRWRGALLQANK